MHFTKEIDYKKILTVVGMIALVLVLFFVFRHSNNNSERGRNGMIDISLVDNKSTNEDLGKDTDNDGAYDWEEVLWGLDPNDPFSNGGTVNDGEYILAKRTNQTRENRITEEDEISQEQPSFENLMVNVLRSLVAVDQQGGDINDEEFLEQMAENIGDYLENVSFGGKKYIHEDITIVESTEENSLIYKERMTSLFNQYPVATRDIEALLIGINDPSENQGQLRSLHEKYKTYREQLLLAPVPSLIERSHLRLINEISQIEFAILNILQDEPDEMISIASIIQLEKIMDNTAIAIMDINIFFELIEDPSFFDTGI